MAFRPNRRDAEEDNTEYDEPILKKKEFEKEPPLWDSFQDLPPAEATGSAASWNKFSNLLKFLKLFTYLFVFAVILCACVVSKSTYLLMVAQLKPDHYVRYCDENKELYALIPEEQRIAWMWALIFAFMTPEIFTFLKASRICFFKNKRVPTLVEVVLVGFMETLHVVGLSLLTFVIFPAMSSVNALMLMNCVCFVPGVLSLITEFKSDWKTIAKLVVSIVAVLVQLTGLILWAVMEDKVEFHLIPLALFLVSFRWWENYVSGFPFKSRLGFLTELREKLTRSRHYIYLYVSPWKVFVFALTAILLDGGKFTAYFKNFATGWETHDIYIKERPPLFSDRLGTPSGPYFTSIVKSSQLAHLAIFFLHILASLVCYIFAKMACKIKIQEFSFSIPFSIAVPMTLIPVMSLSELRMSDACALHGYLPDYLSFSGIPVYNFVDYIVRDHMWVWILWWLSQIWITRHIWSPENDKNASTEKIFIAPYYSTLLVDQCLLMNRRRFDQENFVSFMEGVFFVDPELAADDPDAKVLPSDKVPQLIVCATMWHEQEDEMMEFLKSILRLDEDQCARRIIKKYSTGGKWNEDYYELETHIFFDDAFIMDRKFCKNPKKPPINEYVRTLINIIDEAAYKVYGVNIKIKPPEKIITPYGGRLVWTLPGRTKLIAHLKNKTKIRHKKRWSQVMYMYYLLGYRIMEMEGSRTRKNTIAQNTYILALDGDIDFQPVAVHHLIGRMKVDPDLGAACGRIHPVGKGAMVWFQVFEYSIGHWLQKATEHVIGCVLCSPGCFSLFRGRALMTNGVMKKYTTVSQKAQHAVQYDQGEDRWLCTLLLKQSFRVEYCAASDAYTHAPEEFKEFYNQRRRWVPSTTANILDLLADAPAIVRENNSISMPYIIYQGMLMLGTILGPGTIFLMMVGAFVAVFNIGIWSSFMWNFIPVLVFMLICYYCKQDYQILAAFIISSLYAFVMVAVLIGIIIQVIDDGIMSPASLFFLAVVGQIVITGLLHPQEFGALFCGIMYYITIPSMYMLLMIYSTFNMNDVSWGTRENKPTANDSEEAEYLPEWLDDPLLERSQPGSLSIPEEKFWKKLIEKYLTPSVVVNTTESDEKKVNEEDKKAENKANEEEVKGDNNTKDEAKKGEDKAKEEETPEEKKAKEEEKKAKEELRKLRDAAVFAFLMLNSLFVLVVLLLQAKKDYLHIRWPFNAKNNITYDDTMILIHREYLQLDPIGSLFVLFFGLILIIQFVAMICHRFATMSQILAATQLNWFKFTDDYDEEEVIRKSVDIDNLETVKILQRPKRSDEDVTEGNERDRRNTVHKILLTREQRPSDWGDLEANFRRRIMGQENLEKFNISKKSIKFVENTRKSIKPQTNHYSRNNRRHNLGNDAAYANYGFESEL